MSVTSCDLCKSSENVVIEVFGGDYLSLCDKCLSSSNYAAIAAKLARENEKLREALETSVYLIDKARNSPRFQVCDPWEITCAPKA